MKRTFGTVTIDRTPPGQDPGPYLFFACSATGVNGELWGEVAQAAEVALQAMEPELAQAVLRGAGNAMGGDCSTEMAAILSRKPRLDRALGDRLRFPGHLLERDGACFFVDTSGVEYVVHGKTSWRPAHGEVTGVSMGERRDFWCGGTADAPAFYGCEREGTLAPSVVSYKIPPTPAKDTAPEPIRRRVRPN
jgi:hypothetical protein